MPHAETKPRYRITAMEQAPRFMIEIQPPGHTEFLPFCHGTRDQIDAWVSGLRPQDGELVSDARAVATSA